MKVNFICFSLIVSFFGCAEAPQDHSSNGGASETQDVAEEITINLTALDTSFFADTVIVEIEHDKVFKQTKKYRAVPFQPVLEKLIAQHQIDIGSTELIYTCTDGYQPSNGLREVMEQGQAFLAFADVDVPEEQIWVEEYRKKFPPFYLVWKGIPPDDNIIAWPYGLYAITFAPSKVVFDAIYPKDEAKLAVGFELFKNNCLKCHSINKIGGIMGPEFNYPINITTYWQREHILAFVKNPQSYRYNSKMPAVQHLSDVELNQIVDYLTYMAAHPLEEDE